MPRARYTGGGHYRVGGHGFDPGDEREVDHELADYLTDHEDFEVILEKDSDDAASVEPDKPEGENTSDEAEAEDGFDVAPFLDRNVDPIVEDIHAGKADAHLNAVAEAADRVTINDAIGERRAELEG